MLQFLHSFRGFCLFMNFLSLKPDTENSENFANYASHCLSAWHHLVKKESFDQKFVSCMNVKFKMLSRL